MDISVIIPTHNRAGLLMQAVRSASALGYSSDCYEIIVVDNASTDSTREVVKKLQNNCNGRRLRYAREEQLGLHNARHAGARAAKGEILVFTDDDASFDPRWIAAYAKAFSEHPEMVAAGGPVRPVWEVPPPKWLVDFIGGATYFGPLSLMEPYDEFRLGPDAFFWGVNMAIRRDALFKVGGFNPELIGTSTVGDGESGLNRKLQERGLLIGYVPGALVYHHIPPERMTVDYLCDWQAHLAGAQMYRRYHFHIPRYLGLFVDASRTLMSFVRTWIVAKFSAFLKGSPTISLRLEAALRREQLRYILRLVFNPAFRQMVTKRDWLGFLSSKQENCA